MKPLEKNLRTKLERSVQEARDIAEKAAEAALQSLHIADPEPPSHLSHLEQELHRKLRFHAQQIGDSISSSTPNPGDIRTVLPRLLEEVAYEHWHRMLFARFLAENNLLMDDDPHHPVPVTLEECSVLAGSRGDPSAWALAARFAGKMLPQVFRTDSPVFQLQLPKEWVTRMERLVEDLPVDVFKASDAVGWVYQFWQSRKKEKINASEVKIGAAELPAVTQLFTEPYMVQFLLDNALGAWWVTRRLTPSHFAQASCEQELRDKASIPGVPLSYLRFVRAGDGPWVPIAGDFPDWPDRLSQLKILDPCCGSGHFLVAAFLMLVPMRMELDQSSPGQAVHAVLKENLHGLELDPRCVELAVFSLALAAWRFPGVAPLSALPPFNIACSGLSPTVDRDRWIQFAPDNSNLRLALGWLYDEFRQASILGSLLDFSQGDAIKIADPESLYRTLIQALRLEPGFEERETRAAAQGMATAARLISLKYHWVITNVPYLSRNKQDTPLREYCEKHYKEAKNDLATVFLDRCLRFCEPTGSVNLVLPQNWLFLSSYRAFREKILREHSWQIVAYLGPGAFETISGEIVKAILLSINRETPPTLDDGLFKHRHPKPRLMYGLDVSPLRSAREKDENLPRTEIKAIQQLKQLENPDARIIIDISNNFQLLSEFAKCYAGVLNGDSPRFQRKFWELRERGELWTFQQSTIEKNKDFGGLELCLYFDMKNGHLREDKWIRKYRLHDSDQRGNRAWGKMGVGVSQMSCLPISLYTGETFDSNIAIILPDKQEHLLAIWCYCSSPEYNKEVRKLDQKLNVTNATLVKVPFDLEYWQKVAQERYPHGLPKPYSDDPTQWIFHGHPSQSQHALQVAVARLLGYRWPAELDDQMELSDQAREWVHRCSELLSYADKDGIVCLPPVRGELPGSDRLLNLLAAAYGDQWNAATLNGLLKDAGHEGKDLDTWLKDKFFTQHCTLFLQRPFIWHIWDGLRDGFAALVNYHQFDRKNLESLIYLYLGDWIKRQEAHKQNGVEGAEEKLQAAENLKKKLEAIMEGEAPYDIFVRWKPLNLQPMGWNPDLDDGVRLNIRPFLTVPDVSRRGKDAGVLRDKPNIDWKKDRGKDVETSPWYELFKGERVNDHHLSLKEKSGG